MPGKTKLRFRKKPGIPWVVLAISAALLAGAGFHRGQGQSPNSRRHQLLASLPAKLSRPASVNLPATPVADALPFSIGENSGVLWNLTSGQLLWQYRPHLQEPYASTTKLMTIYLALKSLPLMKTVAISPVAAGTTGSDMRMGVGYHFTVRQLLYGLMMVSANDAAVALGQSEAGSIPAFVAQMNHTARLMGMTDTTYADPDGLSPGSRGSAWDLSIIARADMENPLFRKIVSTKETTLPYNPIVRNINGLLFLDPTVIGIKSGWTTQAGFNLVFAATRRIEGHSVTLLGVIMHGQHGFPPEYQDAEKILQWGFSSVKSANTRQ